ncbi:MAG: DEAD/DEAH box helicase [Intrasporangiaceae bacterium]|nr:DEAD/DEAH box helicase [Intrasporangiaceae bacterium]
MARPPKKSAGKKADGPGAPKKARWTSAQKAAKKAKPIGVGKKVHRKGQTAAEGSRPDRGSEGRREGYGGDRPERRRDERGGPRRDERRDQGPSRDSRDNRGEPRREWTPRPARQDGFERREDRRPDDRRGGFPQRDDRGGAPREPRREWTPRTERQGGGSDRRDDRRREDRSAPRREWTPRPEREGGYERRDDRRPNERRGGGFDRRDDRRRPDDRGASAAPTWEEAEAERAEADSYVKYSGARASGPVAVTEDNGFAALELPAVLVERLARDGITQPFEIQTVTIPDALAGRDVLGRAQTGSGKTLGFGLPLLTRLMGSRSKPKRPRAVVLVPTRELAMQVNDALEPLAVASGLRCRLVAGGLSYTGQISALDRGVDVLIATPGRLKDLRERGAVDFSDVEVTVLDEADHMADMGFMVDVSTILDEIPAEGQRLLFSATLDNGVDKVVERYLTDPVEHGVDDVGASVETMSHFVFLVGPQDKKAVTAELANRSGRTIVFVRTKLGADRVALELQERGVKAAALHGGLTQSVRNRVLGAFREGNLPVLVATDVAARGIHVDDVSIVLQVDPPADHKDYLHRAGRTARAGELGTVVTIALPHQRRTMERMVAAAGLDIAPVSVRPGDSHIGAAGGSTPSGVSVADEVVTALAPKGRGHRRGHPARAPRGGPPRFGKGPRSGDRRAPRG